MHQKLPRSFEDILQRDQWIWQHNAFDLPFLREQDQDRLLNLPGTIEHLNPSSTQLIHYGQQTARDLEQQHRWLEAQAYWLAIAKIIIQNQEHAHDALIETCNNIIRMGVSEAGMPFAERSFSEIIEEGLQNLSVPIQHTTASSLLLIGTFYQEFFEDLSLTSSARIALSQILSPLHGSRVKGTHRIFEESVRLYSQYLNQLHLLIDTIITNPTLENIKGQRGKLLEHVHKLQHLLLDQDKTFLLHLPIILGQELSTYIKTSEDEQSRHSTPLH